jgi:hypothetical protein
MHRKKRQGIYFSSFMLYNKSLTVDFILELIDRILNLQSRPILLLAFAKSYGHY